ncbi:MAG TPA: hypothetical protein VNJ08_10425 [Bacteriovoracaceae bacterium]|nr:hypothetical protein [Bacteriovoracaceae bacterium]
MPTFAKKTSEGMSGASAEYMLGFIEAANVATGQMALMGGISLLPLGVSQ